MAKDAVAELAEQLTERLRDVALGPVVNMEKHQADLERRRIERAKTQQLRDDCLNPEAAMKHELEKPRFQFEVEAKWMGTTKESKGLALVGHKATVIALNENDAWAHFCDQLGVWPGRKACRELKITKGKQVELAEVLAAERSREKYNPWSM